MKARFEIVGNNFSISYTNMNVFLRLSHLQIYSNLDAFEHSYLVSSLIRLACNCNRSINFCINFFLQRNE